MGKKIFRAIIILIIGIVAAIIVALMYWTLTEGPRSTISIVVEYLKKFSVGASIKKDQGYCEKELARIASKPARPLCFSLRRTNC